MLGFLLRVDAFPGSALIQPLTPMERERDADLKYPQKKPLYVHLALNMLR
jgi:hypothetical protein